MFHNEKQVGDRMIKLAGCIGFLKYTFKLECVFYCIFL